MTPKQPRVDAQLAKTLEALNFCFVLADYREPDCPITYASPAFHELTGYSAGEVIGRNCRFLQGPETSRQKVMEMRDAIREERTSAICLINYTKTGTKFWNQFYLAPVRDDNNCVSHYIGIQSDVTQLMHEAEMPAADISGLETESSLSHQQCFPDVVQVEQQEAADLNGLLRHQSSQQQNSVPPSVRSSVSAASQVVPPSLLAPLIKLQQSFVLADPRQPDCPIVHASTAFLLMTGYPREQVLGRNCRFLQGPQTDKAEVQRMKDAMTANPPRAVTVKLLNYKVNGQPFWNALHVAPIRSANGQVLYFVGVQLDITLPPTPKHAQPSANQHSTDSPIQARSTTSNSTASDTQHQTQTPAHTIAHQTQLPSVSGQMRSPAPLQSPAASAHVQQHQQPSSAEQTGLLDSNDRLGQHRQQKSVSIPDGAEVALQQHAAENEGNRQLLQWQSAPAGGGFAAAAARAAMLGNVSHLRISTHAQASQRQSQDLPECGEVTVRHRVDQKGVVGAVRVACRSLCSDGLRRNLEDQCVTGSPRMTRSSGSFQRTSLHLPRHTV